MTMEVPPSGRGFHGLLRVNPANPRYFTDDSGRAIYLTGSHTWASLIELKCPGEPDFDYPAFLEMLAGYGHNFMRLWTWDHAEKAPWTDDHVVFGPLPHARTGPGLALDGQPKFDLGQWNEAYFARLRERVVAAGARGIYVAVMFYEGWCVKWSLPSSDAWTSHPYNKHNNVNGVDGDPNGDGKADVYSLEVPAVVEYQKAYMRKVIDTVGDLDHVLFEIINEIPADERGVRWHYHMIDFVHAYERTRPKQHPVGMTAEGGGQHNPILFESPADWISPGRGPNNEYKYNPPDTLGRKVVLADTDHFWGHGGTYQWVWKSFLRGLNPIFMDSWQPVPGRTRAGYANAEVNRRDYPDWEPLRRAMGQTRRFAERLDLNTTTPHADLASSGYCLADPGKTYLVYLPEDGQVVVELWAARGELSVEWFSVRSGETAHGEGVQGGSRRNFVSPFGIDSLLYLTVHSSHAQRV